MKRPLRNISFLTVLVLSLLAAVALVIRPEGPLTGSLGADEAISTVQGEQLPIGTDLVSGCQILSNETDRIITVESVRLLLSGAGHSVVAEGPLLRRVQKDEGLMCSAVGKASDLFDDEFELTEGYELAPGDEVQVLFTLSLDVSRVEQVGYEVSYRSGFRRYRNSFDSKLSICAESDTCAFVGEEESSAASSALH